MNKETSGIVRQWNDRKGFGFIKSDSGVDIFFHIAALYGDCRPKVGDKVFYIQAKDDQGRIAAKHVRYRHLTVDNPDIRKKPVSASLDKPNENIKVILKNKKIVFQNIKLKLFIFVLLLVPMLIGVTQLWNNHGFPWAACLYLVTSLLAFYLYWDDKKRAGINAQRIPEATLHIVEILGGWIGALFAQQLFRHKTRKLSFQFIFWLIIIVHELFWLDQVFLAGKYFGGIH